MHNTSVRNSCLHLATGRTRDDIGKRIWQRRGRKRSERDRRRGGEEKAGVLKSRHGWTMYGNPVTSEYILDFKKCPIEVYLQVDDHVHPGNCLAAVSSEKKTRPSSYGVLPSPAELGYERTDVVFFFIF
ncbi:hypothetical protein TNCV_2992371 [Trichonephila clavipes]|nr:hypothetical protein TNCV_2992371 [Trichonephila clavipes]